MSKIITLISTFLVLFSLTNINTNAATIEKGYVVTASRGLNVRDSSCNKIATIPLNTKVYTAIEVSKTSINCKINGKNINLIAVNYKPMSDDFGYMSTQFLQTIKRNPDVRAGIVVVNSGSGLNLRDKNCKRVTTVPNKSKLTIAASDNLLVCKSRGEYFDLVPVIFNGKELFAASFYLK